MRQLFVRTTQHPPLRELSLQSSSHSFRKAREIRVLRVVIFARAVIQGGIIFYAGFCSQFLALTPNNGERKSS